MTVATPEVKNEHRMHVAAGDYEAYYLVSCHFGSRYTTTEQVAATVSALMFDRDSVAGSFEVLDYHVNAKISYGGCWTILIYRDPDCDYHASRFEGSGIKGHDEHEAIMQLQREINEATGTTGMFLVEGRITGTEVGIAQHLRLGSKIPESVLDGIKIP